MTNPHLVTLRTRVDRHFADALARSLASFACRPGCDHCCQQRFSVFEVEAAPIRAALLALEAAEPELRARVRQQGRDGSRSSCALLVDGRCSVYAARPLICRSHGLPIAVRDPDAPPTAPLQVDNCPLNFTDAAPPRESVLVLDAVNQPLAVLAELSAPGQPRIELAELAAEPDPPLDKKG